MGKMFPNIKAITKSSILNREMARLPHYFGGKYHKEKGDDCS
jgi:hypothetical protein